MLHHPPTGNWGDPRDHAPKTDPVAARNESKSVGGMSRSIEPTRRNSTKCDATVSEQGSRAPRECSASATAINSSEAKHRPAVPRRRTWPEEEWCQGCPGAVATAEGTRFQQQRVARHHLWAPRPPSYGRLNTLAQGKASPSCGKLGVSRPARVQGGIHVAGEPPACGSGNRTGGTTVQLPHAEGSA